MMERRSKALVLVVDDELAARLITRATLEEGGFDVVEAASAAQALALFEDCHPDVVLLDVMLPDGDGVELCEQLRGLPNGRDVPIAMVTGVNDKESIQRAYQSGATDFITKPISWGTLAHRTRFLLRAHHALRDLALSALRMRLAASVFEASNDAILICDRHNRIISTNPAFTRICGHPAHEVLGQDPALLFADVGTRIQYQTMWETLLADNAWQGEFTCRRRNGDTFPAWFSMSLCRDAEGEPEHYIALFTDISLRKVQEQRIAHLAFHDELTGLPNRRLVADRLAVALAQAKRDASQGAVLFVDIDRFKNINDSLGHACGDQLLEQVALRLQGALRGGDTVGRMGGDEFVLLCPGAGHGAAIAARAQAMLATLAEPYQVMGMRLHVSASMGIACYPDDGDTPEVLVRNADAAMYLAKEQGRNNFQFYAPELNASILSRLKLEMELRRALDAGQFELYYQPKLEMADGRLNGAEVLIRWRNDAGQLVPPNRFIPVAEECGLIGAIGDWVLAETCRQHAAWRAAGLLVPVLAVNVSARQFAQPEFAENMGRMLAELGTAPAAIELELTESMLMADVRRTAATLERLKELGFSIAIDDFGTGFSSLNYLRHFRLDVLKIDQSFVRELLQDRAALAIVQSIIALARALNLQTVAEGVETEAQRALLQEQGCGAMQGYLVARPLPASDFAAWLRAYNKGRPP
ncbi:EAL domain-containing protein [Pseudoduganella sp. DS3]|uniref:EAL domain-containing protein n=1 Tax=Pseudoduganella guangdongensis TaxID=2692179 RepID=A0A6N9HP33_9BURK|nr:EAL domain-containing protein [Pseudoduganella guangdongensis]MYN04445.1 EAL domain-containing protein [Pseudoduganella guangdongensis]